MSNFLNSVSTKFFIILPISSFFIIIIIFYITIAVDVVIVFTITIFDCHCHFITIFVVIGVAPEGILGSSFVGYVPLAS